MLWYVVGQDRVGIRIGHFAYWCSVTEHVEVSSQLLSSTSTAQLVASLCGVGFWLSPCLAENVFGEGLDINQWKSHAMVR